VAEYDTLSVHKLKSSRSAQVPVSYCTFAIHVHEFIILGTLLLPDTSPPLTISIDLPLIPEYSPID